MVTDFSGTSILSNEFVVICRANTDNLAGSTFESARQMWHRGQKVVKKTKI